MPDPPGCLLWLQLAGQLGTAGPELLVLLHPGLPHGTAVSGFQDGEGSSRKAPAAWPSELASYHCHHILLFRASHKTSPDKKDEEGLQKPMALLNLPHGF